MAYPYTLLITEVTGNVLSATDYNNEHQNHINNNDPTAINDDSANVAAMQAVTDPGEVGTESLPTTLDGEIQRLRNIIKEIHGGPQWYVSPTAAMLQKSGGTMSGAIAMGSNKITGLTNGSVAADAAAFGQLRVLQVPLIGTEVTGGTTSSTSFVSIGANVTITPSTATSKIIILASAPVSSNTSAGTVIMGVTGTTTGDLFSTTTSPARGSGPANNLQTLTLFAIDSPGTVSAQTYQLRFAVGSNTGAIGNSAAAGSRTQIMVLEIL